MPELRLKSGRVLGYRTFGVVGGKPVFHFHGIAGSGLDAQLYGDAPEEAGVFLVCPDRPGMGGSDFQPARRIVDWPADIRELADSLGFNSFSVLGVSGGAPYALACARLLPQRIQSCGIVSGAGPANLIPLRALRFAATYFAIRNLPMLYRPLARALVTWRLAHASGEFRIPPVLLARSDREVLADPRVSSILAEVVAEGDRQGSAGPVLEGTLLAGDWGFHVSEIQVKRFLLWHGEADKIVPVPVGRRVASAVSNAEAKFYSEEGHYSLMIRHAREILSALVSPAAQ